MILYFSGSGNSYSVAKQIADQLGDDLHPLALFDDFESCRNAGRIGLVFPCYMGQAPEIVLKFKDALFQYVNKRSAYIFCVSTNAHSSATSHLAFRDHIHAWFEVKMPENDIVNSRPPKMEKQAQLIAGGRARTDAIIRDITDRKEVAIGNRAAMGLLLKLVGPTMNGLYAGFDKHLYADDACTHCKQCTKCCPLKNITLDEDSGKPVWSGNCVNCMGCINRCPAQAIQFKQKTIGKARYVHPDYAKVYY